MNVLVLGDVVGRQGCDFLLSKLPSLKRLKKADICIANGENSAPGNGITPASARMLFDSGVDFITTGNHAFRQSEACDFFDSCESLIRPANFHRSSPGRGWGIIDKGRIRAGVINLAEFAMNGAENPFNTADEIIGEMKKTVKVILVDFHGEMTSWKRAMGFYLDGKVSAFYGTHTHVLTADEQILEKGTGYITDIGMCGVMNSVLGVNKEIIIKKLTDNLPARFDTALGDCMINGCIFEIDESTGKTVSVERININ